MATRARAIPILSHWIPQFWYRRRYGHRRFQYLRSGYHQYRNRGDTGTGDSNTFALDTTSTGTGGDTGTGDSSYLRTRHPSTGTGGDTGTGDSNTFALDTTSTGTGGDTGTGDSNTFALDTTSTGTGGDTGTGDSNTFALDTTSTGTGGDTGTGDSNTFALDTTSTGTGGDTGTGDSNTFALDTTSTGTGGDTGTGDSNTFALDTTDQNNTTDQNTSEGYTEIILVSGGDFASPFYEFNNSDGESIDITTKKFYRGSTYLFQDQGVNSTHPFMIGESWGDTNSSLVTGDPLNGSGGQISLFIPVDYNESLYYFCTNHNSMLMPLILADEGHPVFELNASAVLELTGQNLPAGNYAVVENNESTVDLEPALQDENGTWLPTPASDYVNLVPQRFDLLDDLKTWFDDRSYQPVGFLHFDENGTLTGDNEDSSIPTANLQLWLDGLDIDGDNSLENNPTAGEKIASWKDKSNNGYHANQELVDEQPTVSENGGLSFNGIRNHLTLGSNYIFSENNGMTIFAAVFSNETTENKSGNFYFSFGYHANTEVSGQFTANSVFLNTPQDHGGLVSSQSVPLKEHQVLTSKINFEDKQLIRSNGVKVIESNIALSVLNSTTISAFPTREHSQGPVTIGGQSKTQNETDRFFSGIIREILVYDRALPEAEILQIESYLTEKWHNSSDLDGSNNTETNTAPQFQTDGNLSVLENQWAVFEFNATDADGDALSYSIQSGLDAEFFELNSSSGKLLFCIRSRL